MHVCTICTCVAMLMDMPICSYNFVYTKFREAYKSKTTSFSLDFQVEIYTSPEKNNKLDYNQNVSTIYYKLTACFRDG